MKTRRLGFHKVLGLTIQEPKLSKPLHHKSYTSIIEKRDKYREWWYI